MIKFTRLTNLSIILLFSFSLISCNNEKQDNPKKYDNTLLIYMCGSNLESNDGAASNNIRSLLKSSIPENTNVIVQTGGANKWHDFNISSDVISRYKISNNKLDLISQVPYDSMGETNTLGDFVRFGYDNFNANKMGLILWNHGGGDSDGICFDEKYNNDSLSLEEINVALKNNLPKNSKLDLIGYDACLMAGLETCRVSSQYANYMIASQEIEPVGGWDYTNVPNSFASGQYEDILNSFKSKCEHYGVSSYSLSLIDLSKFNQIDDSVSKFAVKLKEENNLYKTVQSVNKSISFGSSIYSNKTKNLYDLGLFSSNFGFLEMKNTLSESIKTVSSNDLKNASGLNVYYPLVYEKNNLWEFFDTAKNEEYKSFIKQNYSNISPFVVNFENLGEVKDKNFEVKINKDNINMIKSIAYKLFCYTKDGDVTSALCLGYDTDVKIDEQTGTIIPNIKSQWVHLNGNCLYTMLSNIQDDVVTYDSPILKNGVRGTFRFSYNKKDKSFNIIGFVPESKKEERDLSHRIEPFEENDKLTILYNDVLQNEYGKFVKGETVLVKDGLKLSVNKIDAVCLSGFVEIRDLFGFKHRSYSAVLKSNSEGTGWEEVEVFKNLDQETIIVG